MTLHNDTAAICGLFCGICPSYPNSCEGCLSSHVAESCASCGNGFRTCVAEHGVTRCFECKEFPCARLEDFSHNHIENGICHHEHVIEDLSRMKEIGVTEWVEEQVEAHSCKECNELIPWSEHSCTKCKTNTKH